MLEGVKALVAGPLKKIAVFLTYRSNVILGLSTF